MTSPEALAALLNSRTQPATGSADLTVYRGLVLAWDELSGVNTIKVNGAELDNLPVIQGGVGIAYQVGESVEVLRVSQQYFILGKVGAPGAGAANQIRSLSVNTSITQGIQGYGDLTGSLGPSLSSVYIGSSRRCLVTVSAQIATNGSAGAMSFTIVGASSVGTSDDRAAYVTGPPSAPFGNSAASSQTVLLTAADGLNPGFHTITTKYRVADAGTGSGATAVFRGRNLTVQPF